MRSRFLLVVCILSLTAAQLFAAGSAKDRCGTRQPSDEEIAAIETAIQKTHGHGKASVTIPVWLHIIMQGEGFENGDLTPSMIQMQMKVLNDSYSGKTGGAPTGFAFELVGVTRTVNAEWFTGIAFDFGMEFAAKTAWKSSQTLPQEDLRPALDKLGKLLNTSVEKLSADSGLSGQKDITRKQFALFCLETVRKHLN